MITYIMLTTVFGIICYWYGNKEGYADGYEDATLDFEEEFEYE